MYNAVETVTTSEANGFFAGFELESFANVSDVIMGGTNTLGSNIYIDVTTTATTTTYYWDTFAFFDQIVVINNGIATVTF